MTNETRLNKFGFEGVVRSITIFFLLLFVYKLYRLFFIHNKLNDYLFSENLLHYENGYIRRSLLGNLFIALPEAHWKLGVMTLYGLMLVAVLVFIYRNCRNVYALLLCLCAPFGLRMVMFDFGSTYRKEFIFYLLIVLIIILYKKIKNHTAITTIAVLISTAMIMVHESFVFLAMPVIGWILYVNHAGLKRIAVYIILCGLSFLVLSKTPSTDQIQLLDQFFSSRNIDWSKTREYMTFSKAQTLDMSTSHLMQGSILFYLMFFVPILAYLFYSRLIKKDMLLLMVIQLLFCSVLCLVAIDYGRWLSFVLLSFFICLFSYHNLNDFADQIRRSTKEKLIFAGMLLFMLSVYLPHYIKDYDFSTNIVEYSFIEKISYSFSELAKENQ